MRRHWTWVTMTVAALWLTGLAAGLARADKGPKPTLHIVLQFEDNVAPGPLTSAVLLECSAPACADAKPMELFGPQRVELRDKHIFAMAYGFKPYAKWRLVFKDGTRESQVIHLDAREMYYRASVGPHKVTLTRLEEREGKQLVRTEDKAWLDGLKKDPNFGVDRSGSPTK